VSVRRFNTVNMLMPGEGNTSDGLLPGVRPLPLSRWNRAKDVFEHRFEQADVQAKLADWAGVTVKQWQADVARRKAHLEKMRDDGIIGIAGTRAGLKAFAK
jgi:hypothetical protein